MKRFIDRSVGAYFFGPPCMCSLGSNLVSVTVLEIFRVKILTLTFDLSRSIKVKFDGAKLAAGLQHAPLYHPAKVQSDPANSLRDARYQTFYFLALGANPWAKVHQKRRWPATHSGLPSCEILSPCVNPCQRYPLQNILRTNKHRNSKRYIPSMPIGIWG